MPFPKEVLERIMVKASHVKTMMIHKEMMKLRAKESRIGQLNPRREMKWRRKLTAKNPLLLK